MDTHPLTHPRLRGLLVVLTVVVLVAGTAWWGLEVGQWWIAAVTAALTGLLVGRWWVPVVAGVALAGAWAAALAGAGTGVARIAEVAGSLAGLGPRSGDIVVGATVALALLSGLLPAWFGVAARHLVTAPAGRLAPAETTDEAAVEEVADPGGAVAPVGTAAREVPEQSPVVSTR